MTAHVICLAAATLAAGLGDRPRVIGLGGDPAPGLLVNHNQGARPFDPPDPARATVVFVHGVNPAPAAMHFPMARSLGEAVGRRGGVAPNVLGWDWNGASLPALTRGANHEIALDQGRRLAAALLAAGLHPARIHLVGQSSGCIVAASAAFDLRARTGWPVAQVSLIDPSPAYHPLVFERLAVAGQAGRVDHFWAAGPLGLSHQVGYPGVRNVRVAPPGGPLATADPTRAGHLNAVRWYIGTAADPSQPEGYNLSVTAAGP